MFLFRGETKGQKAGEGVKELAAGVRNGKTEVNELTKKEKVDVKCRAPCTQDFTNVHLHVAVHGVSKVKTDADVKGIVDALQRGTDSTVAKLTSLLTETAVKRLR